MTLATKYSYLLDENQKLKTTQNGQDVYVKLKVDAGCFFIPVSMPRRNPHLSFNLEKPDDSFWTYLSKCEQELTLENINVWISQQQKDNNGTSVSKRYLKELLEHRDVCYKCISQKITNPNPQKTIQYLRDSGYIVCTYKKHCPVCKEDTTTYSLTPVLSCKGQTYELIPKALKKKICKVFDYTDAYTGIRNTKIEAHIPDHKFPEDRWNESTPSDNSPNMSEDEIKRKFQLLSPQTNMQKQRFCGECVRSGKRGYPFGIKFYYWGNENWGEYPQNGSDAEKGCVGCGWYDIEEWRKQLNLFLAQKKERQ